MRNLNIRVYRGYVNDQEVVVFGHVFWTKTPDTYRPNIQGLRHALSVIRMFRVNPVSNAEVTFSFNDWEVTTKTSHDGYFRFNLPYHASLASGWHPYVIRCQAGGAPAKAQGELLKPFDSKLGIISDIDDTFLISYTNRLFKKLYVMLFRNVNDRKIFEDVVSHYQALSRAGQDAENTENAFFYVSSSEWNLYYLITEFATLHGLPKAIVKLKKLKTGLTDFLKTGRGDHDHKFDKIKDIITFYPQLQYVLLGDDSQQDPYLYERVCKYFPLNVRAIYIRQTAYQQKSKVKAALKNVESLDVATCYFKNSGEAITHSQQIGII